MRWLIVTHWYPPVIEWCYLNHPGVTSASYAEQRKALDSALFGESSHEVRALRALGHQATDVVVNVRPAQEAWAHEHGITLSPSRRRRWRLRRRFVPWFGADPRWMATPLLAQIEEFSPDVVHVESVDLLERDLVLKIKTRARLVIGQIAAPLAPGARLDGYDVMISSLPNFVARFRDQGLDAELLPLAFEPSVLEQIGPLDRDVPVSFVGSLSRQHRRRTDLLTAVSTEVPVSIWAPDSTGLSLGSPLRRHVQGVAWGLEMYRVMARSRMTINVHIDVAEGHANNLRLFEATGMGALLVTDRKADLGALFDVGREVVAYDDARECADLIRYYVDHPDEAAEIAAAGQARTLRDHTWSDRMARLVAFAETRIQSGSNAPRSPNGRPKAA